MTGNSCLGTATRVTGRKRAKSHKIPPVRSAWRALWSPATVPTTAPDQVSSGPPWASTAPPTSEGRVRASKATYDLERSPAFEPPGWSLVRSGRERAQSSDTRRGSLRLPSVGSGRGRGSEIKPRRSADRGADQSAPGAGHRGETHGTRAGLAAATLARGLAPPAARVHRTTPR